MFSYSISQRVGGLALEASAPRVAAHLAHPCAAVSKQLLHLTDSHSTPVELREEDMQHVVEVFRETDTPKKGCNSLHSCRIVTELVTMIRNAQAIAILSQ